MHWLDKREVLNLMISTNSNIYHDFEFKTNILAFMKSVFQKLKNLKNVKIGLPVSPFDHDQGKLVTLAKNNTDLKSRGIEYPDLEPRIYYY